jgi:SOS response regulatory protein OraA/RecX
MNNNDLLMKRAAAFIARRAHSRGELRRKLAGATNSDKVSDDEIETALDRLEHLNLLNDAEYAYNFALYRIKDTGWGEEKVRDALLGKDVAMAAADCAIERVREEIARDGTADALTEYVEKYCRKHGTPCTLKEAQKMARHLAGRGYVQDMITEAIQRIIPHERFGIGD